MYLFMSKQRAARATSNCVFVLKCSDFADTTRGYWHMESEWEVR